MNMLLRLVLVVLGLFILWWFFVGPITQVVTNG